MITVSKGEIKFAAGAGAAATDETLELDSGKRQPFN